MADNQEPKLPFYIVHCSGEDESFPVRELAKKASNTRGWQTPKMCDYPQELIIRFEGEVEINMIRLLSHESKIAQRLELFISAPTEQMRQMGGFDGGIPPEGAFQRLGFMGFTSNEATNYNSRELKTIHLRHRAAFVKFVIRKHHPNSINPFNQVGLVGITVHGTLLQKYQPPPTNALQMQDRAAHMSSGNVHEMPVVIEEIPVDPDAGEYSYNNGLGGNGNNSGSNNPSSPVDPQGAASNAMGNSSVVGPAAGGGGLTSEEEAELAKFDSGTAKMIRELMLHKARAVEEEDYDLAKNLKQRIADLKEAGAEIANMEEKKKQAVMDEDYDLAKMLKFQIEQLRSRAANPQQQQQQQPVASPLMQQPPAVSSSAPQSTQHQQPPPASFDEQPVGGAQQQPPPPAQPPKPFDETPVGGNQPPPAFDEQPVGGGDGQPGGVPPEEQYPPPQEEVSAAPPQQTRAPIVDGPTSEHDERPAVAGKGPSNLDEMLNQDETGGIVVAKKPAAKKSGAADNLTGWEQKFASVISRLGSSDAGQADPLAGAKLTECKDYISVFGSYCTSCLFSKKWQLREAALKAIVIKNGLAILVEKGSNPQLVISTLLQYLGHKGYGVNDTIGNVFFASTDALRKIVCEEMSSSVPVSAVAASITSLLSDLMLRAGDNNARIREQSSAVLMMCATNHGLGYEKVSAAALNEPQNKTKKELSFRIFQARLSIVNTILEKAGLNRKDRRTGLTSDSIMQRLVIPSLSHSNSEVREAAMTMVVTLCGMSAAGNMQKYIDDMKPQQRQTIEEKLEELSPSGKGASGGKKEKAGEAEMMTSSMTVDKSSGKVHPMLQAARAAKQ